MSKAFEATLEIDIDVKETLDGKYLCTYFMCSDIDL